jgi:hypothetical protein
MTQSFSTRRPIFLLLNFQICLLDNLFISFGPGEQILKDALGLFERMLQYVAHLSTFSMITTNFSL